MAALVEYKAWWKSRLSESEAILLQQAAARFVSRIVRAVNSTRCADLRLEMVGGRAGKWRKGSGNNR